MNAFLMSSDKFNRILGFLVHNLSAYLPFETKFLVFISIMMGDDRYILLT